jgi:cobalt-zinc-cadmium efflux system membrane fusion protein
MKSLFAKFSLATDRTGNETSGPNWYRVGLIIAAVFLVGIVLGKRLGGGNNLIEPARVSVLPTVTNDGKNISIPEGSPSLKIIETTGALKSDAALTATAPARVVAAKLAVPGQKEGVILFESADVTSLFSQYRQAFSNFTRNQKNLNRTKDMYANQAATSKELNDSENDFASARTTLTEYEVKLRTSGFNPADLDNMQPATAWIISDVPEAQIHEVELGEKVTMTFSSFADEVFAGQVSSIGDAVDPTTRTVKVRVDLPNPGRRLMPGMFTRADFGTLKLQAVVIPTSAVVTVEEKDFAFVETAPRMYERRQVFVQAAGTNQLIVMKGINDGEKVVSSGAILLKGVSFSF